MDRRTVALLIMGLLALSALPSLNADDLPPKVDASVTDKASSGTDSAAAGRCAHLSPPGGTAGGLRRGGMEGHRDPPAR